MNSTNQEYVSRINRVIDYIDTNYNNNLSLDTLAEVANFSKFHFHRIFYSFIGETLYDFIQRVRVEKAASKLLFSDTITITDVAYDCGYSSVSVFSRAFKQVFEQSPSQWREENKAIYGNNSNYCKKEGKNGKMFDEQSSYFRNAIKLSIIERAEMFENQNVNAEIRTLAPIDLAYVRYIGPYKGDSDLFGRLYGKLCAWAGPRGILSRPNVKFICVYHDDPNITEPDKLRISVGVTVSEDTKVEGEIGKMQIEGGKYAVGRFEIPTDGFGQAWTSMCGWVANAGFQPEDGLTFELYHNNFQEHPQKLHILDICIPVKSM